MTAALIGSTGFVGQSLARQMHFDVAVHRSDVNTLRGGHFARIVCAGLPAAKWRANQAPVQDAQNTQALQEVLATVRCQCFILISTVDVFADPRAVDEVDVPAAAQLSAYGLHRLQFEHFVRGHFDRTHVLRLPALFGPGLRKNVLYDLVHNNQVERIHPGAAFQWYPMHRLADDIARTAAAGLPLLHATTAPVVTGDLVARFFPGAAVQPDVGTAPAYDVRTRHAGLWGRTGAYLLDRLEVFAELDQALRAGL